ncbi:MAG: 2-oxoglutarate dehydrogenase, E2 component, dihydrolipoamide succinyltransferase [Bacteroidetes bacterium]|jgi:2-oxoglutarate dehydrogenase E2 component (dihydrolipoamide succinyltransferase)|nr:2-oxoglutarate dehydrogenase, E2 component, dihydrolipoamide succinyltransferase [Bacteroidota bacterium]
MATIDVTMPKMGESITEGTVIVWHKQPGDAIEQDETLLEIGTDKVDTEVPSPEAGVLHEILVEEGETVEVGTVIATIETEAEEGASAEPEDEVPAEDVEAEAADEPVEAESQETEEEPEPELEAVEADDSEDVEIVMPKMGESITEGMVIAWHKQPGDRVDLDETLLEIGTDKVDTEVPSPAAGVLKEILVEEGETVEVGTVIAIVGSEASAAQASASSAPAPDAETETTEPAPAGGVPDYGTPGTTTPSATSGDGAVRQPVTEGGEIQRRGEDGQFYSPLVRSIAEKEGLSMNDLQQIDGSGREGRVTKEDVLAYIETREQEAQQRTPEKAPQPQQQVPPQRAAATARDAGDYEGRVEIVEMDRMRQIIAEHMVRSKATSAHVTSFAEADVTNLVRLRERNKAAFQEREGVKLTYTPFFVQAAVKALREHPILNSSVEDKQVIIKKDLHIGIAVAIDKKGLVAPVIRHAGQKNLIGLAHTAANMAERARSKQLQPDELQGGTFTVTNIGSLGSLMGTPIINQPQVGILATGAIKKRPVVIEHPDLGDTIAIRHMMYLSLSYDHRIIDGAMGASFLQTFVESLETLDPDGTV